MPMNTRIPGPFPFIGILALTSFQAFQNGHASEIPQNAVDFRYSPPEGQSAICLPDDPQKSLVDKSGALLYHYEQGGREFGTRFSVDVSGEAFWQRQELFSPRVPIVKTFWSANGLSIVEEAFAVGTPCRGDWICVHVTNPGHELRTLEPRLVVDTKLGFKLADQLGLINQREMVTSSLKMTGLTGDSAVQLAELNAPPGRTDEFSICYRDSDTGIPHPATIQQAVKYWENVPLPYGRIQIPDAGIQALVDSSIRNIRQAREIMPSMNAARCKGLLQKASRSEERKS